MPAHWKRLLWILVPVVLWLTLLAVAAYAIRGALDETERAVLNAFVERKQGLLLLAVVGSVVLFGAIGNWLYRRYPSALHKLASEMRLMVRAEKLRELDVEGASSEVDALAGAIGDMVSWGKQLQQATEARVTQAVASLEQERNRLAALMAELEQAVIVCNMEGRILLYNHRARVLCRTAGESGTRPATLVGLGRSVFAVVPQEVVAHSITRLQDALRRRELDAPQNQESVTVTVAMDDGRLLRVRFATVVHSEGDDNRAEMDGLVLLLEDVSRQVKTGQQRYRLLHQLTESSRAGVANIRAAVETLQQFPNMAAEQQRKFIEVVHDEVRLLSDALDSSISAYSDSLKTQWPLEEIRSVDLMTVLIRNLDDQLSQAVACDPTDDELWLTADSYALTLMLVTICEKSCANKKVRDVALGIHREGRFAKLDLVWRGDPVQVEDIREWENSAISLKMAGQEVTVRSVLERHGGELWAINETEGRTGIRLLLPTSEPPHYQESDAAVQLSSRPEFYDFDLYGHIGAHPDLEARPLDSLSYTVLDTETTGLDTDRDEIISIGALRIVNGRVLQNEVFEQLVDPGRPITRESEAVHGITQDMITGKPSVPEALGAFHGFCEDTVLVGHNVAFDMRFFHRAQAAAGVEFSQPVLDTLLLSAVVYPERGEHSLEKIAERFDVPIVGRHTALGDAIVTGQIFLRILDLLRQQGITTLGEAMRAAKDTYLARVKY